MAGYKNTIGLLNGQSGWFVIGDWSLEMKKYQVGISRHFSGEGSANSSVPWVSMQGRVSNIYLIRIEEAWVSEPS